MFIKRFFSSRKPIRTVLAAAGLGMAGCQTVAPPKTTEQDYRRVQGHSIYVQQRGEEKPGVARVGILTGFPDNTQNQLRLMDALAENRKVFCYDRLGMGLSDKPDVDYKMSLWMEELDKVIAQIAPGKNVLVGHSFGGTLGVYYTAEHPENIRALILINPVLILNADHTALFGNGTGFMTTPIVGPFLSMFHSRGFTRWGLTDLFYDSTQMTDAMIDAYHFPFQMENGKGAFRASLSGINDMTQTDMDVQIEKVRNHHIPTLLLWGENDAYMPLGDAAVLAKRLGAEVKTIPHCGHLPQLELNPQRFQSELVAPIEAFLKNLD